MDQSKQSLIEADIERLKAEYNFEAKRISHPYYVSKLRSDDSNTINLARRKMYTLLIEMRKKMNEYTTIIKELN